MRMMTYHGSSDYDPKVAEWIADHQDDIGQLAATWFKRIKGCGTDITELLHDGYLTACIGDYPFAYVGAFKAHANVGFFYGAHLNDPTGLLQGTGKNMRHVKVRPEAEVSSTALEALIDQAYAEVKQRIQEG